MRQHDQDISNTMKSKSSPSRNCGQSFHTLETRVHLLALTVWLASGCVAARSRAACTASTGGPCRKQKL